MAEILIVDDDFDIRVIVQAALEEEGYHVTLAGDGHEALEQMAKQRPDVVLLDLLMPGMSGWDLHARLREQRSDVPVIVMSAGSRARELAETHHTAGYLAKPFDLDELLQTVARTITAPTPVTPPPPYEAFGLGRLFWRVPEALVVADAATGRVALWNPAAEALFGYTVDEAVTLTVDVLVPKSFRADHEAGRTRYAATGVGPHIATGASLSVPALRKGGEEIFIEVTLTPLEDIEVPGRYVLAVIRDMTERRRLEEELRQETRLRQALLEEIVTKGEHFLQRHHPS